MRIKINEEVLEVSFGESLASIISKLEIPPDGIAVAINGAIVPKPSWEEVKPYENDSLVIITATQGG